MTEGCENKAHMTPHLHVESSSTIIGIHINHSVVWGFWYNNIIDLSQRFLFHHLEIGQLKTEKTKMMYVVEDLLGSYIRLTPKCHPEIAGRGVGYAWGYSKMRYRKHFNDGKSAHLKENVSKGLSPDVLTIKGSKRGCRLQHKREVGCDCLYRGIHVCRP